jgi:hypothetical protein
MRTRTILLTLAACFVGAAAALAADANAGTWKLNSAKSTFTPATPKNDTVIVEVTGDNMKITVDGTDGDGRPAHNMWTGKFDGKDYPVTGDPASDMRSYTKVNDRTLTLVLKKGGKVTTTGRIVLSADGKSRSVTITGMDPQGKKFASTAVYDKQ